MNLEKNHSDEIAILLIEHGADVRTYNDTHQKCLDFKNQMK